MTPDPSADGLLYLLRANPTLLPVAPPNVTAAMMTFRAKDQVHACLRCGKRAQCAYVAETSQSRRWLDLCAACSHWLRTNAT